MIVVVIESPDAPAPWRRADAARAILQQPYRLLRGRKTHPLRPFADFRAAIRRGAREGGAAGGGRASG
jgi:hypothetical protein